MPLSSSGILHHRHNVQNLPPSWGHNLKKQPMASPARQGVQLELSCVSSSRPLGEMPETHLSWKVLRWKNLTGCNHNVLPNNLKIVLNMEENNYSSWTGDVLPKFILWLTGNGSTRRIALTSTGLGSSIKGLRTPLSSHRSSWLTLLGELGKSRSRSHRDSFNLGISLY